VPIIAFKKLTTQETDLIHTLNEKNAFKYKPLCRFAGIFLPLTLAEMSVLRHLKLEIILAI
tara:strand:+ start:1415 stop:1597 length:183 start_codon:yes stop_codon:yes gene_type:complete